MTAFPPGLTQDGCESNAASILFADVKSAKSAVSCLHHKEVEGVTIWARPLGAEVIYLLCLSITYTLLLKLLV